MTRKKVYAPSGKNFAGNNSRSNNFNMVAITDLVTCADCGTGGFGGGTTAQIHPWLSGKPGDVDPGPGGNCQLLYQTILDIQQQLELGRYTPAGLAAKQHELDTAWAKWDISGCTLAPIKKVDIVVDPGGGPGGGGGTLPVDGGGGGTPPVGGGDDAPKGDTTNGDGLPFQTLSGSGGGGASGSGGAISNVPKHKNYFWLVVAGSLLGAFLMFGKNNIAGKPL